MQFNEYTLAAGEIARAAGDYLKRFHEEGRLAIEEKGSDMDFVTNADKASQNLIVEALKTRFPSHFFVGEEDGLTDGQIAQMLAQRPEDYFWIADPLDGTVNYIRGLAGYCVSLALVRGEEVLSAAVYAPVEGELYMAQRGGGAYKNGMPIHASSCSHLHNALICTGVPPEPPELRAWMYSLGQSVMTRCMNVRMLGSAAREMAHVAEGGVESYFEYGPHPWDVAAGKLLCLEAGARVANLDGCAHRMGHPGILAAAPGIFSELTEQINQTLSEMKIRV